jgi:thiol-disulfide isomerase/thioredoxin
MKKCFFTLISTLLLSLSGFHAQTSVTNWFSIKGFLPNWNNASVQLQINGNIVYKGTVQKDVFSYTGSITATKEGFLKLKCNQQTYSLPLFIEPGTIKIRDEGKRLVAFGTSANDTYTELMNQLDSLALLQSHLRFEEVMRYKRSLATAYIKQTPNSIISLRLLTDFYYLDGSADDTLYYQLYNSLDTTIRQSYTGKKLEADVKQRYAVAIGRPAPLLELPDSSHQLHPIYQPGQFTLINFWASWCMPCKREHPTLVKLFNQFSENAFTIVSISLDQNRSAWVNAVKADNLQWLQLSDLKGWKSQVATLYGLKQIPFNILLDASGAIIGKNLRMDEIKAILSNTIGPPPF